MAQNSANRPFGPLLYPRPVLSTHLMRRLLERPDRALSLFGARQIGKTTFLTSDLADAARAAQLQPVYVDLMGAEHPLHAIVGRLQDVRAELRSRPLRERVKGVKALGFGLDLEAPEPVPAGSDTTQALQRLMAELLREQPRSRWLLMLDEVQELARSPALGEQTLRALRALFNQHKVSGRLMLVMTGSSQAGLTQLFAAHDKPSFGLADREDFPPLGHDYVRFVLRRANEGRARGHKLDDAPFIELFTGPLHCRPGDFEEFVGQVLTYNLKDPYAAAKAFLAQRYPPQAVRQRFMAFTPLQRALLIELARGGAQFTSAAMLAKLGHTLGLGRSISGAAVRKAFMSLPPNTVGNPGHGQYVIEDPQLLQLLREGMA